MLRLLLFLGRAASRGPEVNEVVGDRGIALANAEGYPKLGLRAGAGTHKLGGSL
jgi:hypothetical protein